jgi:glucan 1,3-beta-glucosidase
MGQFNPAYPCESSTITPAIVYFPPGVYRITMEITLPYNTIAIGDALNLPTILVDPTFTRLDLFNADPYYLGEANFHRQVRNFIFDITQLPIGVDISIHRQVAQATSLQNLIFNMRQSGGSSNKQQGIVMENGFGGFMRDLIFKGGGIEFFLEYVWTAKL